MIVRRSTYDKLQTEHYILTLRHSSLLTSWNELIAKINAKGGQAFLEGTGKPSLTDEDIKRLLALVHPDRHEGKKSAVEMTQKLLSLRSGGP